MKGSKMKAIIYTHPFPDVVFVKDILTGAEFGDKSKSVDCLVVSEVTALRLYSVDGELFDVETQREFGDEERSKAFEDEELVFIYESLDDAKTYNTEPTIVGFFTGINKFKNLPKANLWL